MPVSTRKLAEQHGGLAHALKPPVVRAVEQVLRRGIAGLQRVGCVTSGGGGIDEAEMGVADRQPAAALQHLVERGHALGEAGEGQYSGATGRAVRLQLSVAEHGHRQNRIEPLVRIGRGGEAVGGSRVTVRRSRLVQRPPVEIEAGDARQWHPTAQGADLRPAGTTEREQAGGFEVGQPLRQRIEQRGIAVFTSVGEGLEQAPRLGTAQPGDLTQLGIGHAAQPASQRHSARDGPRSRAQRLKAVAGLGGEVHAPRHPILPRRGKGCAHRTFGVSLIPMTEATSSADRDPGETQSAWRFVRARRAHVVVDAAAYFTLMQEAMLAARQRIHMIGWDFDTRVRLGPGRRWWNGPSRRSHPARLGAFVVWLCRRRPHLQVRVLKWNFGALKFVFRGSMVLDLVRWYFQRGIVLKFDSAHPLGCSHHQKIVVIDDNFAVCGGIDMTSDRWDTPEHLEDDPRRRRPYGTRLYGPWHDLTMMVEGEAAGALAELGRKRWVRAGGSVLEPCAPQQETAWPDRLRAEFRDVEIGIARTRAAWRDAAEVREIEALFVEHIRRARRFIYAESQYFASRAIAEAIAERLSQPEPPEIVLINPESADGWLEQAAMDGARVRLCHAIADRNPGARFRIFMPYNAAGTAIYVHSKTMIVDDEIVRVGSANMNNRSMGLDSECDLFIDAARPGNAHAMPAIRRLRINLLAEHIGLSREAVAQALEANPSMIALIEAAPRDGKRLEPFVLRPLTEAEKAVADQALLDPERPEELFEPFSQKRGLFRRGGFLRRPK